MGESRDPVPGEDSASLEETEIQDLLAALVERSLVVFDAAAGRYRLLESVRSYAARRLSEAGDGTNRARRHLRYFLQVARDALPSSMDPGNPSGS